MKSFPTILVVLIAVQIPSLAVGQIGSVKGFTEPYRSIEIATGEMGTISKLEIEEGQHVVPGMIVARLNEDVLEASRAIAVEASNAQGKLNSSIAELNIQKQRYVKLKGLFDRNHASQTEIDRAFGQLNVAEAQVEAVKDELHQRDLELARIEMQLEQRRLRSPIGGVITEIYKDEGEFLSPSDPVVANVVQLDPLLVVFMVPQTKANQLGKGQVIELTLGNQGKVIEGQIEFVSPTADAQSATQRVKVKIPNKERAIPSGMACYLNLSKNKLLGKKQISDQSFSAAIRK